MLESHAAFSTVSITIAGRSLLLLIYIRISQS